MPSTKTLNQSPTISAVENADLLWIWNSSASELNKISLTNLLTTTDDINTSFARLNGSSGGQTLIGGTAANDDLTLEATSSATRTTSYVILQPNGGNVGIGTSSPVSVLQVSSPTANSSMMRFQRPGSTTFGFELSGTTFGLYDYDNFQYRIRTTSTNIIMAEDTGNVGIGTTSPSTRLDIDAGAIEFAEMTAPAAGAANTGRLFCRDSSGKTQLCIIFSSGAIQVIATQP